MGIRAAVGCLQGMQCKPSDIGMLIGITNTADRSMPCFAYEIAEGINDFISPDMNIINMQNQGCSVILKAIEVAKNYIQINPAKKALIIAAESHTGLANQFGKGLYYSFEELQNANKAEEEFIIIQQIISPCLFGDGAAAMLIGNDGGIMQFAPMVHLTNTNANYLELLKIDEGGILMPICANIPYYKMSLYMPKRGQAYASDCFNKLMSLTNVVKDPSDSDIFLIHTGNKKILDNICLLLGITASNQKVTTTYNVLLNHGNLLSCSIPFTFYQLLNKKRDDPRKIGLIISFGVGFSSSADLVNFT